MNCHLLVSDLFWPAAAGVEPYRGLGLPALETLLARGRRTKMPGSSLERWLAGAHHIAPQHDLPLAPLALRGDGGDPGDHCWLRADPVHLKVHGDRLILAEASRFAVAPGEAEQLVSALNSHFVPEGITFIAPQPQRWYARTTAAPRIRTTPTAEVAGKNIEHFLPAGDDGARWRRIFNETQMLLHRHPCNEAREARGEPAINSVWLWGAGRMPQPVPGAPYAAVWSNHPLAKGLALASGIEPRPLPATGTDLLQDPGNVARDRIQLAVLTPLPGTAYGDIEAWRKAALALERDWFSPLLTALHGTTLDTLTLRALGQDFGCAAEVTRHDLWRFWRRRRPLQAYAG